MNPLFFALMLQVVTDLTDRPLSIAPIRFIEIRPVGATDLPPPHLFISEKLLGFRQRYPELNDVVIPAVYTRLINYVKSAQCIDKTSPLLTQAGSMVISVYGREHNKNIECGLTGIEALDFTQKAIAEYKGARLKLGALQSWEMIIESTLKIRN